MDAALLFKKHEAQHDAEAPRRKDRLKKDSLIK
jgi:hypothetical protein